MLFRLFLSAAFANAIGLGLGFITHLTLAYFLPIEEYGLYSFIFSICVMISLFAGFGFHASMQRIIPSLEISAPHKIKALIVKSRSLTALTATLCGLLVFSALYFFYFEKNALYLAIGGFSLAFFMSLTRLQVGIFKAFKKGTLGICYDTVFREALFLLLIWGAFLGGMIIIQAAQAIYAFAIILATLFVISIIQIRHLVPPHETASVTREDMRAWLKISLPMMVLIGTQMLLHRADIVMLGFMVDIENVGAYGFAAKISQAATIIFMAGTTIFSPRAAGYFQQTNLSALRGLYKKMQTLMMVGTIMICIALYFLYPLLLHFFDPAYGQGLMAFNILIAGYCLNATLGPSSYLMVMTRHEMTIMWVTFGALFLNVILNLILIPLYGITGAAIATAISLNLRNGIGYFIFLTDKHLKEASR